jgi:hypothetical protein
MHPVLFRNIPQIACEFNGAVNHTVLSDETYQHDLLCTVDRFSVVMEGAEGEYSPDIHRYRRL